MELDADLMDQKPITKTKIITTQQVTPLNSHINFLVAFHTSSLKRLINTLYIRDKVLLSLDNPKDADKVQVFSGSTRGYPG